MPQSGAASTSNAIRGCLQGKDGSYTLRADDGRMLQLTGDTSKLSDNVNKEVEVTGSAGSSETGASSASPSTVNVTDVRKVADTCSSSGSAMPQGSTPPGSAQPPTGSTQPPDGPSDPAQAQDTPAAQTATPQSAAPQSTTPPAATPPTAAPEQNANPANPQTGTQANKGTLPQTASPLPLMGLVGFGSLVSGVIARMRKR